MEPGRAQPGKATWLPPPPLLRPIGSPPTGRISGVGCAAGQVAMKADGRTRPRQQKLALGMWKVTSLGGKEPELVRKVECYRLDLVRLTSSYSRGSGTLLLDRGWTLFFSGVAQGLVCWAGVGILTSPRLSAAMLEFTPVDETITSLGLRVIGVKTLTVVCTYALNYTEHTQSTFA